MASYDGHASKRQRTDADGHGVQSGMMDTFDDPHKPPPSNVVHMRGLANNVLEQDILDTVKDFGKVSYILMMPKKKQALVEFEDIDAAISCVNYSSSTAMYVAGAQAYFNYSTSKRIQRPPGTDGEQQGANHILLFTILYPNYPITVDVMHTICQPHGDVQRIVIFKKNGVQAMVEFDSVECAKRAKAALNGADIYSGCCRLKIEFANPKRLNVHRNDSESWDYTNPSLGREPVDRPPRNPPLLQDPRYGEGPIRYNKDGSVMLTPSRQSFENSQSFRRARGEAGMPDAVPPALEAPHYNSPEGQNGKDAGRNHLAHQHHSFHGGDRSHEEFNGFGRHPQGPAYGQPAPFRRAPEYEAEYGRHEPYSDAGFPQERYVGQTFPGPGGLGMGKGFTDRKSMINDPVLSAGTQAQQGAVLMVYNLNMDKINCSRLFNLFCLYGNVVRTKFLKSKEGSAMIQMGDPLSCERVIAHLNNCFFFGNKLQLGKSKQAYLQDVPNPHDLQDGTPSFMDFMGSKNNRFTTPESAQKNRIHEPTKVLHYFNAPPNMSEDDIKRVFEQFGVKPPKRVRQFPSKSKPERSSTGLVEFDSAQEAIEALIVGNHAEVTCSTAKNPYIFKLCFSAKE
ncbi:heterogeneous nuclear ribonucleoprotein L-like isoform X3 [Lineus longissimus]|uniref:heterogeneous nuclear ribonucleoprotein L-like isoform X3 n=1 Tax=Lineus longissimus TaxID=88925 RepID=UPI002B4E3611